MISDDFLRIKAIAGKMPDDLTKAEKTFVKKMAAGNGVSIKNRNCKNCYIDAAVQIYAKMRRAASEVETPSQFILRDGVDVIFQGVRVNAGTITDDIAKDLISRGFNKDFFVCE